MFCETTASAIDDETSFFNAMFTTLTLKQLFTGGSDSSRFGGVGLGLYLVKLVGDLIGGRVGLESSLGLGSVFYLDLPLSVVPTELQSDMTDSTGNLESAILGSMSIEVKKKSTGIH